MRQWVALLILVVIGLGAVRVFAHPREVVPSGHWAYAVLRRLAAAGLVPYLRLATEPLTRGEIAILVRGARRVAETEPTDAGAQDLLRALEAEFLRDNRELVPSQASLSVGTAAGSDLTVHPALASSTLPTLGTGLVWDEWVIWGEAAGHSKVTLGRAYAAGRSGTVELVVGRDRVRWGQSPRTTLFLDAHAGNLDAFRLSVDWPQVRLAKVFSPLPDVVPMYLVATRVDWQVNPRLRIGFVELTLARSTPLLPYWILNPFAAVLTGLTTMWVQSYTEINDNPLGGVEFDFLLQPGVVVYGQLLADDIITMGNAPQRLGGQLGAFLVDPFRTGRTSVRIEYSAVTNWTYTEMSGDGKHFLMHGRPLGFWLGNDADDAYIEVSHVLSPEATLTGWIAHTRHGEGRIGTQWPSQGEAFSATWLSGVVEARGSIGLQYEWRTPGRWLRGWGEIGFVRNRNNTAGMQDLDYRVGVSLSQEW